MRIPVPRPRSLAAQLFAMQAVLIAVVVAGYALFTYVSDRGQAEDAARVQARAVARAVADSPSVREAIGTPDPTAELQPYALRVMADTEVDFVTIMSPRGIRWTHPDQDQIGKHFLGNTERALKGETFTETYKGTLGYSVRAVTPVEDDRGRVIGLVSAGIQVEKISERAQSQLTALLVVAGGALALGAVGTYVINARLRRHTHGMNAAELSRMHDYHEAALHAVREGLLMLDGQYRVALINDGGRELLGVSSQDEVIGRSVADLGLPAPLTGALLSSEPRVDEVHLTSTRVLVVNTSPVSGGEQRGTVVTLRDVTQLQSLMGELDSERGFTQALRSQAHEAANRLHTVVSLIELGRAEQAVDFATAELELAQALTDQVVAAVSEPVLAALLLGKTAQANERGVELVVSEDSRLDDGLLPESLPSRDLVTILGNLIDNAMDAAQGSVRARVTVTAYTAGAGGGDGSAGTRGGAGSSGAVGGSGTGGAADPAGATGTAGGPSLAGTDGSSGTAGRADPTGTAGRGDGHGHTGAVEGSGKACGADPAGTAGAAGGSGTAGDADSASTAGMAEGPGPAGTDGSSGTAGWADSAGTAGTADGRGTAGAVGGSGNGGGADPAGTAGAAGGPGTAGDADSASTAGMAEGPGPAGTDGSSGTAGRADSAGTAGTADGRGTAGAVGGSGNGGGADPAGTAGAAGGPGTAGSSGKADWASPAGMTGRAGGPGRAGADGRSGTAGWADPAGTASAAGAVRGGGRALVLRVADTGAGVDPDHVETVFQRGFSTKPAGPGGRGLGLALVRQTVNRCKGTLTVREAEGGGAEFEVRLPLGTEPSEVTPGQGGIAPEDTPHLTGTPAAAPGGAL
ncbi:ATP-binding protein [Streptomyces sp. WSLK1-5]